MLVRFFGKFHLGLLSLVLGLTLCAAPLVGDAALFGGQWFVSHAQAKSKQKKNKKRNKGKKKNKSSLSARKIKREKSLSPKKETRLDDEISKTEEIVVAKDEAQRPILDLNNLGEGTLKSLLDEKVDEEIGLARNLLEFERTCEGIAPVKFRLANLYWEKSKRAFFRANDFKNSEASRKRYSAVMLKLQQRTVRYYDQIIEDCPGYSLFTKVLFELGKTWFELEHYEDGFRHLRRIVKEYPNSEWNIQAWFMIGEYYFNTLGDAKKAYKAYTEATRDPRNPVYGLAVYKQGWCHINRGEWDLALDSFKEVLKVSGDPSNPLDKKGRLSLRREAIKDYVRSYSHIGLPSRAYTAFRKITKGSDVQLMMEHLGNWYLGRDEHQSAITIYRELLKRFQNSTRNPLFQGRIVDAVDKSGGGIAVVKEVKALTKYFKESRKKLGQKSLNKKKSASILKNLQDAEGEAENTLRRLALAYHKDGKKLAAQSRAQKAYYTTAYELYKHYLEVFPEPKADADVNYVFFMRFYFAEILYFQEKFLAAAQNYDAVLAMSTSVKSDREKKIRFLAAEDAVRAYDELAQDFDRETPPKLGGTKAKKIPSVKRKLIDACQRYIDIVGNSGERIVEIRYKMARIYYTYNHFDEASPAFDSIVRDHPEHDVACYAANLALDISNGRQDYKSLRSLSRSYMANKKLQASCRKNSGEEDIERFSAIEAKATFYMIKKDYEDAGKFIKAGNAYLKFHKEYSQQKGRESVAIDAVYNAALNFDRAQKLKRANDIREFLVKTFGQGEGRNNPLVADTLYNIAQSYDRVVDFRKAAQKYEIFANAYPKDRRTRDALYNAGVYRSTLKDYKEAEALRRRYLQLYPGANDSLLVTFAMCESFEQQANEMGTRQKRASLAQWKKTTTCYESWANNRRFVAKDPDRHCLAASRRGEIYRTNLDNENGYKGQKRIVLSLWNKLRKGDKSKASRCAAAVGQIMFRETESLRGNYTKQKIAALNPLKKNRFDRSIAKKVSARDRLVSQYKKVAQVGDANWSLASLYMIGDAYRESIKKLLAAPIPNKLPGYTLGEEDKANLRQQLHTLSQPIEALAIDAYELCVSTANRLGVYNSWTIKASEALQEMNPQAYPRIEERMPALNFASNLSLPEPRAIRWQNNRYVAFRLEDALVNKAKTPATETTAQRVETPVGNAPKKKSRRVVNKKKHRKKMLKKKRR
jgi:tetratricopeptide (TPR) repeat protein